MNKMIGTKRFYPADFPSFPYEPDKNKFKIISSEEYGEGIISKCMFEEGDIIFKFTGVIMSEMTLHTLQLRPGVHIHDPYFMGKVLHSCDPNMKCDMETRTFTAVKSIHVNDFLTMDYETTEDELFRSFHCNCGSINCKGVIRGKNFINNASLNSLHAEYLVNT